jgi:hypothetical protein
MLLEYKNNNFLDLRNRLRLILCFFYKNQYSKSNKAMKNNKRLPIYYQLFFKNKVMNSFFLE